MMSVVMVGVLYVWLSWLLVMVVMRLSDVGIYCDVVVIFLVCCSVVGDISVI